MNRLICGTCGAQRDDAHKTGVCRECGHIMKMPPLSDGAFEKVGDSDIVEPKKPEKKVASKGTFGDRGSSKPDAQQETFKNREVEE